MSEPNWGEGFIKACFGNDTPASSAPSGEGLDADTILSLWRDCGHACNDGNAVKFARAILAHPAAAPDRAQQGDLCKRCAEYGECNPLGARGCEAISAAQQGEDEPPLPEPDALVKRSEWDDAKSKRQSFNGWRVNYGDCEMGLFMREKVRQYGDARAAHARAHMMRKLGDGVSKCDTCDCPDSARPGCRSAVKSAPDLIAAGALRQFMHNDGSGFVPGYDKAITDREFARLSSLLAQARAAGGKHDFCRAIEQGLKDRIRVLETERAAGAERAVPEGWKLVPVEPTQEMLIAGVRGFQKAGYNDCDKLHDWTGCYRAMLAAAPSPAAAKEGGAA